MLHTIHTFHIEIPCTCLPSFSLTWTFGRFKSREPFDWSRSRQPLVVIAASKIHHPRFFMRRFHAGSGFNSRCMSNGRVYHWKIIVVVVYKRRGGRLMARYRRLLSDGVSSIAKPRRKRSDGRKVLAFHANRPKRDRYLSSKHLDREV